MTETTDLRLPVAEERVVVTKNPILTGRVTVRTRTEETEETVHVQLDEDVVDVERVAINREVEQAPPVRTEGDITIIPVLEEVVVVEKRLVLKEELRIRRRVTTETVDVPVVLRKQQATVERMDVQDETSSEEEF